MISIPESVLNAHVWPRVHQLRLRPSMHILAHAGPSFFEDMPDLTFFDHHLIRSCDDIHQFRGWSQRVTEFGHCVRHNTRAAERIFLDPSPRRRAIHVHA